MPYPYEQIFAGDPASPEKVASNGVVTIFAPGDPNRTPLTITTLDGLPLPNPIQVNESGHGPAFLHATLDQVAWAGGGLSGLFVSYTGIKDEAIAARQAAEAVRDTIQSGELKGDKGDKGDAGPNTLPTQEAVAKYVSSEGNPVRVALNSAIATRATAAKTTGDTVTASDLLRASKWSSDTDFLIPVAVPQDVAEGSEFALIAEGKGQGRVVAAEENLFPFPDAVAGFSGGIWQARGAGTVSVASGVAPGGRDAIRVTATAPSSSGGFGHNGHATGVWLLSDLGLNAGDVVSARAWLAPPAGQSGRIQIRFYRGSVVLAEPPIPGIVGTGVRYVNGVTIPEETTHIAVLSYTTAPSAGTTCDIAQVRVARGPGPINSYIDGSSVDGKWWGTPHQSPSSLGRVAGDRVVPGGGRSLLRYEGSGLWSVTPVGTGVDVLKRTDVLAVDRDNGQQGIFAPSTPFTITDIALTAGRTYVTRVVPSRDMLIQGIGFRLTASAATNDSCSVGLYSTAGARLVTSGSVTGYLNSPTGTKTIPVAPTRLRAGMVYYVGFSSTSTASIRRGSIIADAFGMAIPAIESGYAPAHPAPIMLPPLTAEDAALLFILKEFE